MSNPRESLNMSQKLEGKADKKQLYGLTVKSMIVSLCFLALMIWLGAMGGLARKLPEILMDVPSRPALFMTTVLLLLNPLLLKIAKRFGFTQRELVVIYLVVGFGYLFSNLGFMHILLFAIMWPQGIILEGGEMGQAMEEFIGRISSLLIPQGDEAILHYYMGGLDVVPWSAWIAPMIMWLVISLLFVFIFICLASILIERWAYKEHLTFPLVVPVLELTETDEDTSGKGPFWTNKLILIGALVPMIITFINAFRVYFPAIPYINLTINIGRMFGDGAFAVLSEWPYVYLDFNFLAIGVAYLIPLEVSFSVWFFYVVQRMYTVLYEAIGLGRDASIAFINRHNFGSALGIALAVLWLAKSDIKETIRLALFGGKQDSTNLPLPIKVTVIGGFAAFIVLALIFHFLLGVNILVSILFLLFFIAIGVAFARVRSEVGVPMSYSFLGNPKTSMVDLFGTDILGKGNMAGLGYFHWEYMPSTMIWTMEGLKMADTTRLKRCSVVQVILISFVFTFILGFVIILPIFYEYGAVTMCYHRYMITYNNFQTIVGEEAVPGAIWSIGSGALIVGLLSFLRAQFIWWPFHPLGYVMGWNIPITFEYWGPFFIGWLIKIVLLRYGGTKLLGRARPLFIGMIAGVVVAQSVSLAVRVIVQLLTRGV